MPHNKDSAVSQGGRDCGKTSETLAESVTAAEPVRRDGKSSDRQRQEQAIYQRLAHAVGTGHSRGVDVDKHILAVTNQVMLRRRVLDLALIVLVAS